MQLRKFNVRLQKNTGGQESLTVGVFCDTAEEAIDCIKQNITWGTVNAIDIYEGDEYEPLYAYATDSVALSHLYEKLHNELQELYKKINHIGAIQKRARMAMFPFMTSEFEVHGPVLWRRDEEDGVANPISPSVKVRP